MSVTTEGRIAEELEALKRLYMDEKTGGMNRLAQFAIAYRILHLEQQLIELRKLELQG